jgi:hypothetical protein
MCSTSTVKPLDLESQERAGNRSAVLEVGWLGRMWEAVLVIRRVRRSELSREPGRPNCLVGSAYLELDLLGYPAAFLEPGMRTAGSLRSQFDDDLPFFSGVDYVESEIGRVAPPSLLVMQDSNSARETKHRRLHVDENSCTLRD